MPFSFKGPGPLQLDKKLLRRSAAAVQVFPTGKLGLFPVHCVQGPFTKLASCPAQLRRSDETARQLHFAKVDCH